MLNWPWQGSEAASGSPSSPSSAAPSGAVPATRLQLAPPGTRLDIAEQNIQRLAREAGSPGGAGGGGSGGGLSTASSPPARERGGLAPPVTRPDLCPRDLDDTPAAAASPLPGRPRGGVPVPRGQHGPAGGGSPAEAASPFSSTGSPGWGQGWISDLLGVGGSCTGQRRPPAAQGQMGMAGSSPDGGSRASPGGSQTSKSSPSNPFSSGVEQRSPGNNPFATLEPGQAGAPTEDLAAQLVQLGFDASQAAEAARRCSSVEAAVEWLLGQR